LIYIRIRISGVKAVFHEAIILIYALELRWAVTNSLQPSHWI